ncbi:LacI family DNA-binding transcriptional regulator [Arthrobacter sp. H-02-3]|uniref:LacI family DNA-binding transcriptional regulator n=1 Tax=Arthrobacter sp. H-02-3 TaxID=2703675 RepID=UPI000DD2A2F0|nr:LacI family DNA-binding transcriptional regulator [Arthrobacter sp. H-02-3]PVZ60182.1 LacI family transcriptional regulator [Arthrobacter sp. H-02-3]
MRHGSKPTIRDVAETAGVSVTTVSYVLSGRSGGTTRISEATQDRVHAAVRELGYVANRGARGMRRGRTELVAVAVADLEDPRDRALATLLAAILPEHGYQAVVLLGGGWRQFMLAGGADGVIRTGASETAEDSAAMVELAARGVAQVLITDDAGDGTLDANRDGIPDVQAGYDVVSAGTESTEALAERAVTALLGRLRS